MHEVAPKSTNGAPPPKCDAAKLRMEIDGLGTLADLKAFGEAHKADIGAIRADLNARYEDMRASIRAAVDNVRTVAELDALHEATPGADIYPPIKAIFDGARRNLAEVEAAMQ